MINVCELCEKIKIEEEIRERELYAKKIVTAQKFAEEILNSILENVTVIPKNLRIGYQYHSQIDRTIYYRLGGWVNGTTWRGYDKKERRLENEIAFNGEWKYLDIEVLNQYLLQFGYQITIETEIITITQYSSYVRDIEATVDILYLSAICPKEFNTGA